MCYNAFGCYCIFLTAEKECSDLKRTIARKRNTMLLMCAVFYVLSVAIRYSLAIATHAYPTVMIDEMLYYNIARSIANGTGVLYMGQPADYSSILYPLVISPVYALFPDGANYFRLIQLWNILLMNLSIFPVCALAKAITGDEKAALCVGAVSLVLPDMFLGGLIMSESIIYPLFFAMMYCAYRHLEKGRIRDILLVGFLGGLIYFTKPGQVVPALVVIAFALIGAIRKRSGRQSLAALAGLGSLAATIAASYLLLSLISHQPLSLFGLYGNQINPSSDQSIGAFVKSVIISPFYFFLACGGGCFLVLLVNLFDYSPVQKQFLLISSVSVLLIMLGTAWVVNRIEYDHFAIHTRYVAAFVPIVLAFCLIGVRRHVLASIKDPSQESKRLIPVWSFVFYIAFCALVFGVKAGILSSKVYSPIPNPGLSFLRDEILSEKASWLCAVLIILFSASFVYFLPKMKRKTVGISCLSILIILSFINNAFSYNNIKLSLSPSIVQSAESLKHTIDQQDYLIVYGDQRSVDLNALNVNTSRDIHMIHVTDLFMHTDESGGVYTPFVPTDLLRGINPSIPTPDVYLWILDDSAFDYIKFSDDAAVLSSDPGGLHAVLIPQDKPWVDCFLGGPDSRLIKKGRPGRIRIYDESLLHSALTIDLDIELDEASEFQVYYSNTNYYSFNLPAGRSTYSISISAPTELVRFLATDSDMHVYGYEIGNQ